MNSTCAKPSEEYPCSTFRKGISTLTQLRSSTVLMTVSALFSTKALRRSPLHFELGKGGGRGGSGDTRRRLLRQYEAQVMKQEGLLRVRLGIARHDQAATIGSRKRYVEHLNASQFLQDCSRCQSGRMHPQPMPQRHRQTVSQEGNQDVRVHAMLQLMVDRPNTKITLQAFERRFDLRQLHVSIPQHGRIFRHQIRPYQIVTVTQFSLFQPGLVELKRERLPCYFLRVLRQVDFHESESPPRIRFGGAHAHQ